MRISDWSSDVCSSDLKVIAVPAPVIGGGIAHRHIDEAERLVGAHRRPAIWGPRREGVAFGRWALVAGAAEVPGPGKGAGRDVAGAAHAPGLADAQERKGHRLNSRHQCAPR